MSLCAREGLMSAGHARTFGELLKLYRQMKGLSQEELAERADLSVRGISDLEREARQSAVANHAQATGRRPGSD